MSGWSSFEEEQGHFNNWRSFLNEEFYAAGIDSAEMKDSLLNWLKPLVGKEITGDYLAQILQALKVSAEEEDILLEALGGPTGPNKKFSFKATSALNSLIDDFDLAPPARKKLEKTINGWANTNQIQFTVAPPAPPPKEEPAPGEEENIVTKAGDTAGAAVEKARELASSDAGQAIEAALDVVSFVPVANVPASIASALINIGQRQYGEAAMSLISVVPFGAVAGKAGKLGPLVIKMGEMVGKAKKLKGTKSASALVKKALAAAGSDATVGETIEATKKFVDLYQKVSTVPGAEGLTALADPVIAPLEHLIKTFETPARRPRRTARRPDPKGAPRSNAGTSRRATPPSKTPPRRRRRPAKPFDPTMDERVQRIHEEKFLNLMKEFTK